MDLFEALPTLRSHALLQDKSVALVSVSTIICDKTSYYFEINPPKYWGKTEQGAPSIGISGVSGSIKQNDNPLECLQRNAQDQLGARLKLDLPQETFLLNEWRIAGRMHMLPTKKRPTPWMVILTPPRLGGPGMPDHLAILVLRTRLRGTLKPAGLFGLLRIEQSAAQTFFSADTRAFSEAQTHPGVEITLTGEAPPDAVLRPVLTARAFQVILRDRTPPVA